MRFLLATAVKDWKQRLRDPAGLLLWIGIPLVIGALMTMATGGKEGPKPQAYVLIADLDDSFISGFLVGALSQEQAGGFVRAESVTLEDGEKRIGKGDGTALLVIPVGFADAVLREEPTELRLVTNPSQRILPAMVEESLSMFVDATFYLHRLIGEDLREFAEGPPDSANTFPDLRIAEFSVRINQFVERLSETLFPPVVAVEFTGQEGGVQIEEARSQDAELWASLADPDIAVADPAPGDAGEEASEEATETPSLALLFLPGLLFMSLLFMAQGVAMDLWQEREKCTLRRVVISPQSPFAFLAGKILAGVGLMLLVSVIALSVGFLYFGIQWKLLPLAAGWGAFSGGVLLVMMMLIQLMSPTQKAGSVISMAVTFPLMMLGGSFFPFEAMPTWMVTAGSFTPNGWALLQLKEILAGSAGITSIAVAAARLVSVTLALFLLAGLRLRSTFAVG